MSEVVKVERRGGARPNAGRKPSKPMSLSAYQVKRMLGKARRYARQYGKDPDDLLFEIMYTADASKQVKLAAIKLFKECTMAKITEEGSTNKELGPAFFLPEKHPRLKVVEGGKTA